jgi:hypothetical protein
MRVITMRGSDHEPPPYRLMIQPGGLSVARMTTDEAYRSSHSSGR